MKKRRLKSRTTPFVLLLDIQWTLFGATWRGLLHDFYLGSYRKNGRYQLKFLSTSEWLDNVEGASTGFMVASGGVLSGGYGHGGPGVCLGDGQTEAEGIPTRRSGVCPIPDLN